MQIIHKYFPELSSSQLHAFASLEGLYTSWNSRINLVSRKDLPHLYERHVLHSLAPAKFLSFPVGASVLDLGTGGGFPGIPLAIYFPQCRFHLVDSIGKKIKAVQAIMDALGLKNVTAEQIRAENHKGEYDYVVSRAVTTLAGLYEWSKPLLRKGGAVIAYKGGDLALELHALRRITLKEIHQYALRDCFEEPFFEEKQVIHIKT